MNLRSAITFGTASRYMGFYVDFFSTLTVIACISIIVSRKETDTGLSGLSITFTMQLVEFLQFYIRQFITTHSFMTSVARVISYSKLEPEAALIKPEIDEPLKRANWPQKGEV